jgi:hypothetical protein
MAQELSGNVLMNISQRSSANLIHPSWTSIARDGSGATSERSDAYRRWIADSSRAANDAFDLAPGDEFNFSYSLLPESLARTSEASFLSETERVLVNHITGRGHLMIGAFLVDLALGCAAERLALSPLREPLEVRALARWVDLAVRHRELLTSAALRFDRQTGAVCSSASRFEGLQRVMLAEQPLALLVATAHVGLAMRRQGEACDDEGLVDLDPLFERILHQQAAVGGALASIALTQLPGALEGVGPLAGAGIIRSYFNILSHLDDVLEQQAVLDAHTLQCVSRALDRTTSERLTQLRHLAYHHMFVELGAAGAPIRQVLDAAVPGTAERMLALHRSPADDAR